MLELHASNVVLDLTTYEIVMVNYYQNNGHYSIKNMKHVERSVCDKILHVGIGIINHIAAYNS